MSLLFRKKEFNITDYGAVSGGKESNTLAFKNAINDFSATQPNQKWLIGITEFHIPAGKVYLSPIIDCFDGMVVSWTIGTSPNAELVNTMLKDAINTLNTSEHPMLRLNIMFRNGLY